MTPKAIVKSTVSVFIFIACILGAVKGWALDIYLKNGDKISGKVVREDDGDLVVQTMEAGEIRIHKAAIDVSKTYPQKHPVPAPPPAPAVQWKKDLSLGYTQEEGNTKSQLGNVSASIDRKTAANEAAAKYTGDYSSSNGKMNGKKFYGLLRYAFSFGPDLKWYNFYKMEGSQDYFAGIDYRLDPSTGIGYWFSNNPNFKFNAEAGAGFQYTHYRANPGPDEGGEPVLVPRFFIDKRLIGNLHLSEDFTFYPSLSDAANYRFRSETDLVHQITKRWAFKISYVDDFNAVPPPGVKKNDSTWVTSLEYHF